MLTRPNPASGVPIYLQLVEQLRHLIDTGALRAGEQLPSIRHVAEALVMNPNTVAKAYRELELTGVVELRHGSGAFVAADAAAERGELLRRARPVIATAVETLVALGLGEAEIRRLVEGELARQRAAEDAATTR